jgi:hypothetical protein
MAALPASPRVRAMVLCDEIMPTVAENDVYDLLGVRTEIRAAAFPHVHPRLAVYLQVSGHQGTADCHVIIIRAEDESEIAVAPIQTLHLAGPLFIAPIWWTIDDCSFPEPGVCYVQAYFGAKLLNERLFILSQTPVTTNGQAGA